MLRKLRLRKKRFSYKKTCIMIIAKAARAATKISIENYLINSRIKRKSMVEIDTGIPQNNIEKNWENLKSAIPTWKYNSVLCYLLCYFIIYKKDEEKNSPFGNIEVKKSYKSEYPVDINNVDIKQILISDKVSYDKKGS